MIGLGVGIDYALFIVSRFRQELRRGADVGTAVATAVGTAGSAVVTAGLTVVIALTGLFVAGIPFLTQMGLAAAATIVVAVLVALTLVPAALGFLGVRALPKRQRPQAPTRHAAGRGFLAGWVTTVTRHRVVALLLTVVAGCHRRAVLLDADHAGADPAGGQHPGQGRTAARRRLRRGRERPAHRAVRG
jgi:RND superfamily putative drug exporter